jgi:hypothetical protein
MKRVRYRQERTSVPGCRCRGRRLDVAALGFLVLPAIAVAAEPTFGDLPAAIAKERPSASVPADLPGSRTDPCAVFAGVRVFVPRRGVLVDADPAALAGAGGNGCAGSSTVAPPDLTGALPFGETSE